MTIPSKHDVQPLLFQCCASVIDSGANFRPKHWLIFHLNWKLRILFEEIVSLWNGIFVQVPLDQSGTDVDWLKGEVAGKTGVFPDSYAECIADAPPESIDTSATVTPTEDNAYTSQTIKSPDSIGSIGRLLFHIEAFVNYGMYENAVLLECLKLIII